MVRGVGVLGMLVLAGCASQEVRDGYLGPRANGRGRIQPDMSRNTAGADRELQADSVQESAEDPVAPEPLLEHTPPSPSAESEKSKKVEEGPLPGERIARSPAPVDDDDRSEVARQQRFTRAMELIESFQYTQAQKILVELTDAYQRAGKVSRTAECLFWNGYCYEKTDHRDRAVALYESVVEDYAQTRSARSARRRLDALASTD